MGPSQPRRRRTVLTPATAGVAAALAAGTGADTTPASARVAAQRSQAALADTLNAAAGIAAVPDKAPATPGTAWRTDPKADQVVVTISAATPSAEALAAYGVSLI